MSAKPNVKVSGEVAKAEAARKKKRELAEAEVLKSAELRKMYTKDLLRQKGQDQALLDLWWERGADVVTIRRSQSEDGERAAYGKKSIPNLAIALGFDPRAFYTAADFHVIFEGDNRARMRFFKDLKSQHNVELSWTHVETVIRGVGPSVKDLADPTFKDMITMAAANDLSVAGLKKELHRRFRLKRDRARRLDVYAALGQLTKLIDGFNEQFQPKVTQLIDTIGDDPSALADPSNLLIKLTNLQNDSMSVDQAVLSCRTALLGKISMIEQYVRTLRDEEAAAAAAAVPEEPAPSAEPDR